MSPLSLTGRHRTELEGVSPRHPHTGHFPPLPVGGVGGNSSGDPEQSSLPLCPDGPLLLVLASGHFVNFTVHSRTLRKLGWACPLLCPALLGKEATAQGHRILLINLGKDERPGGYYWVALLSR